jgi:AcrR family transcriptional regulator
VDATRKHMTVRNSLETLSTMPRAKQNLYGQEMGNKGLLTRSRILDATAELMQRRPLRELRVAEIGSLASVSSSTFYLYFESVGEAGLAVVEELNQATPELMKLLESEWTRENVFAKARAFVQTYISFWDRHHAILRVRNFIADEGDKRFFDARRKSVEPIHFALQAKIAAFQPKGPDGDLLDPASTTSIVLAMIERTASIIRLPSAHKATRPRQIQASAFLVAAAMIGLSQLDSGEDDGAFHKEQQSQSLPI